MLLGGVGRHQRTADAHFQAEIGSDSGELGLSVVMTAVAAFSDTVDAPGDPPIRLAAFVLLPTGAFLGAYAMSASFRAFTARLSLAWIVGAHVWRQVGLGFVSAWLYGALPAGFALPAGLGDAVVALGALALVPRLRRGDVPRRALPAWNLFGFVDLVAAIALGLLYSNGPFGVVATGTATTEPMVTFPVSLIPTFLVPLFLLLHGLVFVRVKHLGEASWHPLEGSPNRATTVRSGGSQVSL